MADLFEPSSVHHAYLIPVSTHILSQGLKARGNVEEWLGKVEEGMFSNLRKLTKIAITDFERRPRKDWVVAHCSQVCLSPLFYVLMIR